VQEISGAGETVRNGQKRSDWGTDRTKTAPRCRWKPLQAGIVSLWRRCGRRPNSITTASRF